MALSTFVEIQRHKPLHIHITRSVPTVIWYSVTKMRMADIRFQCQTRGISFFDVWQRQRCRQDSCRTLLSLEIEKRTNEGKDDEGDCHSGYSTLLWSSIAWNCGEFTDWIKSWGLLVNFFRYSATAPFYFLYFLSKKKDFFYLLSYIPNTQHVEYF